MKNKLTNRTKPLTELKKKEFLDQHLKYRLKIMNTYKLINKDSPDFQSKIPLEILGRINDCSAEAARITCRMFIEFMGLRTSKGNLISDKDYWALDGNSYEVKIVDLGGKWVDPNVLTSKEQILLTKTYETGNKATAHLTHNAPFGGDHEIIYESIDLINRLLKTNLFEIVGQNVDYQ